MMKNFLKFITHLIERPKMYYIQEIDDFYFMVAGYIVAKGKKEFVLFMDQFSSYLSKKYNFKKDTSYNLIIKSRSIYDSITLDLLKEEMHYFINKEFSGKSK